jgi:hypothetical protein
MAVELKTSNIELRYRASRHRTPNVEVFRAMEELFDVRCSMLGIGCSMFSFLLQCLVRLFKPFANLQRVTSQKFRRGQAPAAFALQFKNPQRMLAATDNDAGFVRR